MSSERTHSEERPNRSISAGAGWFVVAGLIVLSFSSLFGSIAIDLARWASCGFLDPCNAEWKKVEASNIARLAITIVAVLAAGLAVELRKLSPLESIIAAQFAVLGAVFPVLRAAESARMAEAAKIEGSKLGSEAATPLWELLITPVSIWFVVLILFAIPLVPPALRKLSSNVVARVYLRIGLALFVAAFVGGVYQGFVEATWRALPGHSDAVDVVKERIVAPVGTIMAMATWGVAMLDPSLRRTVWGKVSARARTVWTAGYAIAALAIGSTVAILLIDRPWLDAWPLRLVAGVALLAPGIFVLSGLVLLAPKTTRPLKLTERPVWVASLGAFALGGGAALIASSFAALPLTDRAAFVVVHGGASAFVVVVAALTDAFGRWLELRRRREERREPSALRGRS